MISLSSSKKTKKLSKTLIATCFKSVIPARRPLPLDCLQSEVSVIEIPAPTEYPSVQNDADMDVDDEMFFNVSTSSSSFPIIDNMSRKDGREAINVNIGMDGRAGAGDSEKVAELMLAKYNGDALKALKYVLENQAAYSRVPYSLPGLLKR